ncbi:MAG: hypothetical protein RL246_525 [Bacteroidota bacterium]
MLDFDQLKADLDRDGVVVIPGFFERETIEKIHLAAKRIFQIQFDHLGLEGDFLTQMTTLFKEHLSTFISCGKLIQTGLVELYQLSVNPKLIELVKDLGLSSPLMCTRPMLFFNHPQLAMSEHFYKTPLHQDWVSMLASQDSIVVWFPLIDLSIEHGPVIFYPGSHKLGPLTDKLENGFAEVPFDRSAYPKLQPEVNMGDIVVFSTLLVHESGVITNNEIRWSSHLRYTNMEDPDFIDRGFPSPYINKPSQELIDQYLHKK